MRIYVTILLIMKMIGNPQFLAAQDLPSTSFYTFSDHTDFLRKQSFRIFQEMLLEDDNQLLAPQALMGSLHMLYAGADSHTRKQWEKFLDFSAHQEDKEKSFHLLYQAHQNLRSSTETTITMSQSLKHHKGVTFKTPFLAFAKRKYHADFLEELKGSQQLDFTSNFAFDALWSLPFERKPREMIFSNYDLTPVTLHAAEKTGRYHAYSNAHFTFIEIPLLGKKVGEERFTSYWLLPHREVSLSEVERRFSLEAMQYWKRKSLPQQFKIQFPLFDLHQEGELIETFKRLGLESCFTGEANYSKLADPALYPGTLKHRIRFWLHRKGIGNLSELKLKNRGSVSLSLAKDELQFDRPFYFFIEDQVSGAFVLMGRISHLSHVKKAEK